MRLVMAVLVLACLAWAQESDVVIANGRVMDPASGLDGVRHIGVPALFSRPEAARLPAKHIPSGPTNVDIGGATSCPDGRVARSA